MNTATRLCTLLCAIVLLGGSSCSNDGSDANPDASPPDASPPDASPPDASPPDAAPDEGPCPGVTGITEPPGADDAALVFTDVEIVPDSTIDFRLNGCSLFGAFPRNLVGSFFSLLPGDYELTVHVDGALALTLPLQIEPREIHYRVFRGTESLESFAATDADAATPGTIRLGLINLTGNPLSVYDAGTLPSPSPDGPLLISDIADTDVFTLQFPNPNVDEDAYQWFRLVSDNLDKAEDLVFLLGSGQPTCARLVGLVLPEEGIADYITWIPGECVSATASATGTWPRFYRRSTAGTVSR